jgi:hypothetical protein
MLYQVDDALLHAMSGIELSRVRTELRLLLPEAYQQKSDPVERSGRCYAIKWPTVPCSRSVLSVINSKIGLEIYGQLGLGLRVFPVLGRTRIRTVGDRVWARSKEFVERVFVGRVDHHSSDRDADGFAGFRQEG